MISAIGSDNSDIFQLHNHNEVATVKSGNFVDTINKTIEAIKKHR